MNMETPPRWAEVLLQQLLSKRDQETVVGDLREEYGATIYPKFGGVRAKLWYLQQVLSLLRRSIGEGGPMKKTLLLLSIFTLACACWLGALEMTLRHPGYGTRLGIAGLIALISIATILLRTMADLGARGERWLWLGAVALSGIGEQAFVRNARAAHFEGFVLVISVALVMQGALTLASGFGRKVRPRIS